MNFETLRRNRAQPPVPAHQARIDAIQAAARAEGVRGAPKPLFREPSRPALVPSEDVVDIRLEEEINYARRVIEAAGDALANDPLVLHRHQTTLQSFDIVSQMLGHLARVVGSQDRGEAIERIGMSDLRARLQRPNRGIDQTGTIAGLERSGANPFSGY